MNVRHELVRPSAGMTGPDRAGSETGEGLAGASEVAGEVVGVNEHDESVRHSGHLAGTTAPDRTGPAVGGDLIGAGAIARRWSA
jgi:hypothetical protein